MQFLPMYTRPTREGVPFLVLRHGNEAANFLIQQVQIFEGEMYPDALAFSVDWHDRITDAVGWREIRAINAPVTITQEDTP